MKSLLIICVILTGIILQSGCCNKADCDISGGAFQLRLMRDGKNALYGPDAFIENNSINAYIADRPDFEEYVEFIDTFQSIYIFIEEGFPLVLEWNGTMTDTFTVTTEVTDNNGCCSTIIVKSVMHNGQIICTEECEDVVIDVEI